MKFEDKLLENAFNEYIAIRKELGRTKPICLMDLATVGAKYLKSKGLLDKLDESEEINACTVKMDVEVEGKTEKWLLLFKNETHNHPTEIEPFGGAATCIGGAIRDPLSGRSYVYGAMRVTGAADPLKPVSQTIKGKLPQRKLVTTAAAGYSSYGNQIGLATGIVERNLPRRICRKAHGNRRGHSRRPRGKCQKRTPRPRRYCNNARRSYGTRRLRRSHRFFQIPHRLFSRPAAPRCKRATPPRNVSFSAFSVRKRFAE